MSREILESYQVRVDGLLRRHVQRYTPKTPLSSACAYAVLNGGKRLRPVIALMLADALGKGGKVDEAAIGIEVFHCASLVADDMPCMDDDDMRRDQPATHKAFGEGLALLASYGLISDGYECIARCSAENAQLDPKSCQLALECASKNTGLCGATGGQFLDVLPPDSLTEEVIREVHQKKTVSLFEIAFVYGWLFGGGNLERLEEVKELAGAFGMAFQIADDIGDREQDAENERAVNFASRLGIQAAVDAVKEELDTYRKKLVELGVDTEALTFLASLVQESAEETLMSGTQTGK